MNKRSYLVITPCRNEQDYIEKTISSIVSQTIRPKTWLIVDDGSTDQTPDIIAKAANEYDFIKVLTRKDRGKRSVGPGVIQSFYSGLDTENLDEYEYVCKLDADISFDKEYFENVITYMEKYPRLGNFSGKTYIHVNNKWVSERMGDENAIGPSKFYRVACFQDIGGFVRQISWDGIDGHMCRMHEWIALSIDTDSLIIKHYRPQGSSQENIWVGRKRWGRGKYYMGSSLIYVLAVSVYRLFETPFLVGGVGILTGYLSAMFKGHERFENKKYFKFFRKYEFDSLVYGKKRTLRKYNSKIVEKYELDKSLLKL